MSLIESIPKLSSLDITETDLHLKVDFSNGETEMLTLSRGEGDGWGYRGLYIPEPTRVPVQTCHLLIERPDKTLFFLEVETDDAEAVFRQLAEVSKKVVAASCEVCGAPSVGQYPEDYHYYLCAVHLKKAQLSDALEDELAQIVRDWAQTYELTSAEVSQTMAVVSGRLSRGEQAKVRSQ